jgi:hypothetical protein
MHMSLQHVACTHEHSTCMRRYARTQAHITHTHVVRGYLHTHAALERLVVHVCAFDTQFLSGVFQAQASAHTHAQCTLHTHTRARITLPGCGVSSARMVVSIGPLRPHSSMRSPCRVRSRSHVCTHARTHVQQKCAHTHLSQHAVDEYDVDRRAKALDYLCDTCERLRE